MSTFSLKIADLPYLRHGMPELIDQRSFNDGIAAAAGRAACDDKQVCMESCPCKLPIRELLTRAHETYMPVIERCQREQAA